MIHFKKHTDESRLERRFFLAIYIFVFCGGIYAGMYTTSFGILVTVKHNVQAAIYNPSEYFKYLTASTDNDFVDVKLNIKFKNYIKLSNKRSRYVHHYKHLSGYKWIGWKMKWMNRDKTYVKGEIKYNNEKYKIKARLFGGNNDHFRHPYKWSFRVKSRDKYIQDFQNGRFNLLQPHSRMYITDLLCNKILQKHGMLNLNYTPINLKINDKQKAIYFIEDFFSKNLIERNGYRDSFIFTFASIKHPTEKKMTDDQFDDIDMIRHDLVNNPTTILDEEKMNTFLALLFIAQNKHSFLPNNLHFFYNNVSNKVEPTIREVWFEKALSLNSEDDLKSEVKKFITFLRGYNKKFQIYLDLVLSDPERLNAVYNQAFVVAQDIADITSTKEWIKLKDVIYAEYPRAVHLCKNIKINSDEILKVKPIHIVEERITHSESKLEMDTQLNENLVLEHTDLVISEGVTLDLNGFDIIIESGTIQAISKKENPIQIINSKINSDSSVIVKNSSDTTYFNHVVFKNLSSYNEKYWHLPSAITFYEANVVIENAQFEKNSVGDDFVNFFRCDFFKLNQVAFNDVKADAIDSDFSEGIITNSSFMNIGNDAIDGSGSTIDITNCIFDSVEDKVISAGEKSRFTISDSFIKNSEIAFVSKDDSKLSESNNTLENNALDYCVFNKKEEFLHGTLVSDKDITQFKYLIENRSEVYKNNEKALNIKMVDSVKESLYGKEYGKKSIK